MMMASSTTTPSTRMNANKLRMFTVMSMPGTGSIMNAPRNATTMPNTTHAAIFRCRNTPRMMSTRIAPSAMFFSIMVRRPSRSTDVSAHTVRRAPLGSVALRCST